MSVVRSMRSAVRSPEEAKAAGLALIGAVLVAQLVHGAGRAWITHHDAGIGKVLSVFAGDLVLPLITLVLASPFLFAPLTWWPILGLFGCPAMASASTVINLIYQNGSTSAQLMSVIGALYAAHQLRRWSAYIVTSYCFLTHAILVFQVLPANVALGDLIYMDVTIASLVLATALLRDRQDLTHAKLHQLASMDLLTGLQNRGQLDAAIEAALGADTRSSLLLVDVDRFKQINDGWGHPAGDAALVEISRRLEANTRSGDEFAILFQGCDIRSARRRAETIVAAIAGTPLLWSSGGHEAAIPLSVSVGLAESTGRSEVAGLYAAADRSLYAAKHAGRGLVAPVPETEPIPSERDVSTSIPSQRDAARPTSPAPSRVVP